MGVDIASVCSGACGCTAWAALVDSASVPADIGVPACAPALKFCAKPSGERAFVGAEGVWDIGETAPMLGVVACCIAGKGDAPAGMVEDVPPAGSGGGTEPLGDAIPWPFNTVPAFLTGSSFEPTGLGEVIVFEPVGTELDTVWAPVGTASLPDELFSFGKADTSELRIELLPDNGLVASPVAPSLDLTACSTASFEGEPNLGSTPCSWANFRGE